MADMLHGFPKSMLSRPAPFMGNNSTQHQFGADTNYNDPLNFEAWDVN